MAIAEAKVTYPGVENIIGFDYTLEHGITPGLITLYCTPQNYRPQKQGNVTMTYLGRKIVLKDCIADNLNYNFGIAGNVWTLRIIDRRWKWRYCKISGRYNIRLPHGPVDRMDPRTEKSIHELMVLLLEAMGEKKFYIAVLELPKVPPPQVFWDNSNPAKELADLCDTYGMRIVLKLDGTVAILAYGKGGARSEKWDTFLPLGEVMDDSGGYDPPERPDEIHFICGATRHQCDFLMEAVGDDVDGLVKPVEKLSYAPKDGWENCTDRIFFTSIPLLPQGVPIKEYRSYTHPRELAKNSIYRKYRITHTDWSGKPVKPVGYPPPGLYPGRAASFQKITDVRQFLPFGTELIEPSFDAKTGWYQPLPIVVWGIYAKGMSNNFNDAEYWTKDGKQLKFEPPMLYPGRDPITGLEIPSQESTVVSPELWSLDNETGIFTFSQQMYMLSSQDDPNKRKILFAKLMVRAAVTITSIDTRSPVRHVVVRKMPGTPLGTGPAIVRDDDLFVRFANKEYIKGGVFIPAIDTRKQVEKIANERLDDEERKYQTVMPRAVQYAGWQAIEPDGIIQQINWSMGQNGAFTKVSLNDEIAVVTIPYSERRFAEKLYQSKMNEGLYLWNKEIAEKGFAFSKASGLGRTGR